MASSILSLLIVAARSAVGLSIHQKSFLQVLGDGSGCADLANHGTHFTIDVEVGTPPQRFAVVADTGSNSLIVPSCACQQKGKCSSNDRCFTGTNKSSTFHLEVGEDQAPISMVLSFGSGQIQAVVAQEQVMVGSVSASLQDGLLLMTDRALNIAGPFEGILGLGLPQVPTNWTAVAEQEKQAAAGGMDASSSIQDIINKILGKAGMGAESGAVIDANRLPEGGGLKAPEEALRKILEGAMGSDINAVGGNATFKKGLVPVRRDAPKGFLEQVGIGRFSMCFNDGASGVLRIGEPPMEKPHGGMGKAHWGLDFRGISVGGSNISASIGICKDSNMSQGQMSPCGAIPDSGTTVMMGPADQVSKLLESLCDRWPRCHGNYTKLVEAEEKASQVMKDTWGMNPFDMKIMSKSDILQLLLMDCDSWMGKEGGLHELPALYFHIRGSNGTTEALKIPAQAYIMESSGEEAVGALKLLEGISNIPMDPNATKSAKRVCSPAFGTMEYNTQQNGPVWILGTPIFYEYIVGYDMNMNPPAMSFTSTKTKPCGSCGGKVNLAAAGSRKRADNAQMQPRRISGSPRLPNIDLSQPL